METIVERQQSKASQKRPKWNDESLPVIYKQMIRPVSRFRDEMKELSYCLPPVVRDDKIDFFEAIDSNDRSLKL